MRSESSLLKLVSWFLLICSLMLSLGISWKAAQLVPTFHLDGAFQTASAMFHIKSGDVPGIDFLPYLGFGPILLMVPTFFIFGGTLSSSVASAFFITILAMQTISALLACLIFRKKSFFLAASAAIAVSVIVGISYVFGWDYRYGDVPCNSCVTALYELSNPGNSLRPLRSFAPYLFALVTYLLYSRAHLRLFHAVLIGVFSGVIAAIWSNDYGLVSSGLWIIFLGFYAIFVLKLNAFKLIPIPILAILTYAITVTIMTLGNPRELLQYNFVDVRGDQFWYYAPWFPEGHIFNFIDLLRNLVNENAIFPLFVIIYLTYLFFSTKSLEYLLVLYIGVSLFAGGTLASVAGHIDSYYWAFKAWGVVSIFWVLAKILFRLIAKSKTLIKTDYLEISFFTGKWLLTGIVALIAFSTALLTSISAINNFRLLKNDQRYVFNSDLGGFIEYGYQDFVNSINTSQNGEIVEEYWGLLSAKNNVFSTQKVDSVIHALGNQRMVFSEFMETLPKIVVTTTPAMDWAWTTWNISANWWFYKPLFENYEPKITSPTTVLWLKSNKSDQTQPIPCEVDQSSGTVSFFPQEGGLYEIELSYEGQGTNARSFTMIQNNLNYPYQADGYLALNPGASKQNFPVWVTYPGENVLASRTTQSPSDNNAASLNDCSAKKVTYSSRESVEEVYFPPRSEKTTDYTSEHWRHGVNVSGSSILLERSLTNFLDAKNSTQISIGQSSYRNITNVIMTNGGVEIYFDGIPLIYETIAKPQMIQIQR